MGAHVYLPELLFINQHTEELLILLHSNKRLIASIKDHTQHTTIFKYDHIRMNFPLGRFFKCHTHTHTHH